MKLASALIGVAALGGVALSSGSASATTVVVPAGYVCNEYGHCWHRHYNTYGYGYGFRYYHPHYYYGGWHRHWNYGYGYGWRWHRWHGWNSGA